MTPTVTASVVLEPTIGENVPLLIAGVAAGMYWLGGRRFRAACRSGTIEGGRVRAERWRAAALAAALITAVLALQEPVDSLADELLWVHMVQHVLLLVVVPPLLLLAAPWMRMWRALPLGLRRPLAAWAVHGRTAAPLRGLVLTLGRPVVAWALLAVGVTVWHVPAAYDLTLNSNAVHYAEHASFLIFALLAWGQVIDSAPFHSGLDAPRRVAFVFSSMTVEWALALALAFASRPWYAHYADLSHRGHDLSALSDQQLAAGVMWVPASLPWSIALFILLYRWLPDARGELPGRETERVLARPPRGPVWPPAHGPAAARRSAPSSRAVADGAGAIATTATTRRSNA